MFLYKKKKHFGRLKHATMKFWGSTISSLQLLGSAVIRKLNRQNPSSGILWWNQSPKLAVLVLIISFSETYLSAFQLTARKFLSSNKHPIVLFSVE